MNAGPPHPIALVLVLALALLPLLTASGCATRGDAAGGGLTTALPGTAVVTAAAGANIVVGKTARADLLAALGKTTSIRFDSGFEVWIYKYRNRVRPAAPDGDNGDNGNNGDSEFVVLLSPSGVVHKTRVRTAPPPLPKK